MGATRRGQLCLALLCVLHVQSGSAAVPRTAASQPRLADDGLFENINEQVQVMTGLLDELDEAVNDVTTVSPPPSTTTPSPEPTDPSTTPSPVPTDPSTTPSSVPTDPSTTPSPVPTDPSTTPSSVPTDPSTTPSPVPTDPSTTPSPVPTDPSTTPSPVPTGPDVESNPGDHEPIFHLIEPLNSVMPDVEEFSEDKCEQAQTDLTKTLDDANDALELVADGEFSPDTLQALEDSNSKINITVDCTKSNKIQLTDDAKSDLKTSIKDTQKTADKAEKTIDNIINPTPEPLPSLAISSPFMIVLITFSCLLAVVALVGVAMLVSRSVQGPPAAGNHRRPTSGRVNAGYRPTETDTTELVERPGGRRRATTAAPVAPTAPAVSADPDRYDRLYEGAIPRAHASSPPNAGRSWDGELQQPAGQSAPPARREFYNAY